MARIIIEIAEPTVDREGRPVVDMVELHRRVGALLSESGAAAFGTATLEQPTPDELAAAQDAKDEADAAAAAEAAAAAQAPAVEEPPVESPTDQPPAEPPTEP